MARRGPNRATHANAPLTIEGRLRLVERCRTRPIAHVAREMGISRATASKSVNRYRKFGEHGRACSLCPPSPRLAAREEIDSVDVLDDPFLALPPASGRLPDYWLSEMRAKDAAPASVPISSTEETVEALAAGLGVCLVAVGNVSLIARKGAVIRPITGISHS